DAVTERNAHLSPDLRHHRLQLQLQPLAAIGAVFVQLPGGQQVQVASSTGEGNQNDPVVHFGLGAHSDSVTAEITWPDGSTQSVICQPDVTVTVRQAGQ
ncbi:MAG: ASPIC/UnbV domain-containing protein, partial [Armatimonadota bacterium]